MKIINFFQNTYEKPELKSTLCIPNVSLPSQCVILYWITLHKINNGTCTKEEFELAMNYLLSHTMGPVYSVRLNAQYMSARLFHTSLALNLESDKYSHTLDIVTKTLKSTKKAKDKTFVKLKKDYLVNLFDILEDLTPCGIFWATAKYGNNSDVMDDKYLDDALNEIDKSIDSQLEDGFIKEWKNGRKDNTFLLEKSKYIDKNSSTLDKSKETGTIQKKYIPWKNMSDINVFDTEKEVCFFVISLF